MYISVFEHMNSNLNLLVISNLDQLFFEKKKMNRTLKLPYITDENDNENDFEISINFIPRTMIDNWWSYK